MKATILSLALITLALISCGILDTPKEVVITDSTLACIDTTIHKIDSSLVKHDTIKK